MNAEQLAEIKARAEAATPGPWEYSPAYVTEHGKEIEIFSLHEPYLWVARTQSAQDTYFILQARTDIPALLAEVERLRAALEVVEYPEEKYCCPWCHAPAYDLEHRADCQRQIALGLQP